MSLHDPLTHDFDAGLPALDGERLDPVRARLRAERERGVGWRRWGPYLSARQWGTVREDYSPNGVAWEFFPHDHARSRAYRWGEDGLLGICDEHGLLNLALTLWNERDPILKERLFGLTGNEGNHGEDVKECYFFLDNVPCHSWMRALYKYPQRPFPYAELVERNRRSRSEPEFELIDTGVFDEDRYFDVVVEYAKAEPDDIYLRVTAVNRGPESAPLQLLPTLWFRNTWSWGREERQAELRAGEPAPDEAGFRLVRAEHGALGQYWLAAEGAPELLFTENESNAARLWGVAVGTPFVKDGINDAVVHGVAGAVNPALVGTKAAARYRVEIPPGASATIRLRLTKARPTRPFTGADAVFAARRAEADAFHATLAPANMGEDARLVQRQAYAGLLWSKQLYCYNVDEWLDGDPASPPPPAERLRGRNAAWRMLDNADVLSMPDTWEYPWYAAWDMAFHCVALAQVDPDFAKQQLLLLLHQRYMHHSGQLPAYEWAFSDVNPPVHAWAAWRVYKIERRLTGRADRDFLQRVFLKLLLNFSWWVNRKDADGRNVFQGGFLGLDNIGVFDRTAALPTGGHLDQADGTAWMGMYCLNMLAIALELAREDGAYEDMASMFYEHFLLIAGALNAIGAGDIALWDEQDEFFYDALHLPDGREQRLRARSLVGVIPLFAVETIEPDTLALLPRFARRLEWFAVHHPELAALISRWDVPGAGERRQLALVRGHRMKRVLARVLDPREFLSPYGVRSLSAFHAAQPYRLTWDGAEYTVGYEPGESATGLFGGNSNWRGPIWYPLNYLLIESLQKFHHYYGDDFTIECPAGSGSRATLWEVAHELSTRLTRLFLRDSSGRRPVFGAVERYQTDPLWRDYIPFHEYFHGDTGQGLGASHQTGWTALVAKLLEQTARSSAAALKPEAMRGGQPSQPPPAMT